QGVEAEDLGAAVFSVVVTARRIEAQTRTNGQRLEWAPGVLHVEGDEVRGHELDEGLAKLGHLEGVARTIDARAVLVDAVVGKRTATRHEVVGGVPGQRAF